MDGVGSVFQVVAEGEVIPAALCVQDSEQEDQQ